MSRGGVKNKRFGSVKEREYANLLRREGYRVERAGASLGDYDLIAIYKSIDGNICPHSLWIQVKAGKKIYVDRCKREWIVPSLPSYHHARLACYIREERKWYDWDGEHWREH